MKTLFLIFIFGLPSSALAQTMYDVVPTGRNDAIALNQRSEIVLSSGGIKVWSPAGVRTINSPNTNGFLFASAINDSGEVVGADTDEFLNNVILRIWKADGTVKAVIPSSSGGLMPKYARAINNSGMVGGWGKLADGNLRPFVWTQGGGLEAIPYPATSDTFVTVIDINNNGVALGEVGEFGGKDFTWSESGGVKILSGLISAKAINDSGDVCGVTSAVRGAFRLSNGNTILLEEKSGQSSECSDINNSRIGVGSFYSYGPNFSLVSTAALFESNGKAWDLNKLVSSYSGSKFTRAKSINDKGEILVEDEQYNAYLLKPNGKEASKLNLSPIMDLLLFDN